LILWSGRFNHHILLGNQLFSEDERLLRKIPLGNMVFLGMTGWNELGSWTKEMEGLRSRERACNEKQMFSAISCPLTHGGYQVEKLPN
jgi:hypothetical protein